MVWLGLGVAIYWKVIVAKGAILKLFDLILFYIFTIIETLQSLRIVFIKQERIRTAVIDKKKMHD